MTTASLRLSADEQAMLAGEGTRAEQVAMGLITRLASITGAPELLPIAGAHIDGCLYHGQASVDFSRMMAEADGQVRVPTTLNVGIIDLLHPELFRGDPAVAAAGREMMAHYRAMGCRQTWTCAPYQLTERPGLGTQVAWAESNAIVFCNSVLGARTERYGDFIDLAAAITGRVPNTGLHREEGRLGQVLVRVRGIAPADIGADLFFAALGHMVGRLVGTRIPVIDGVSFAREDDLKALGAAAASAGAVAMFHMVGVTPEAPDLTTAFGGRAPERTIEIGPREMAAALAELSTPTTQPLGAISVGTPHFSHDEFQRAHALLAGRRIASSVAFYISTGRDVLARVDAAGWGDDLRASGVTIVTDTCTYLTPILRERPGAVMTNSAKWAWYAPGNLGYEVIFATLEDCVESAVRGERVSVRGPDSGALSPGDGSQPSGGDAQESETGRRNPEGERGGILIQGEAVGEVLALDEPLSFWGGVRERDGQVIDVHHPQHGQNIAGKVVVMPGGRGSSSSSSVLAELIRGGVAPSAIVLSTPDPILALGAMVGEVLYQRTVPMVVVPDAEYALARGAVRLRVSNEVVAPA
jgi:predicted aconitase/predicted aconitase with swiveling domain